MPDTHPAANTTLDREGETGLPGAALRRIYLMNDLPPEVVAVAFAKTSRSPEPFDQIAAELTEAASAKFHEKWVVGYGHASVAEHAVLSLAVENVSILAAKAVEDNRLSSFTEKSTRYQVYDPQRVYRPSSYREQPELMRQYEDLITTLLKTYVTWMRQAISWLKDAEQRPPDVSEKMWEARLRAKSCDAIRYLLPTATLTNLGWTINARALAGAIRKLGGSRLPELRDIAMELKVAAMQKVPTLLKYSDPDPARYQAGAAVAERIHGWDLQTSRLGGDQTSQVHLLHSDADGLQRLCGALAYPNQRADWMTLEHQIARLSTDDMIAVLRCAVDGLGPFDPLPRPFEQLNYLIEITVDYGAWRDIQRHRIGTQNAQELSPDLGFTVPVLIQEMGLGAPFGQMAEASASAYDGLSKFFPDEAVYALMLAFRKRSLFAWNLREVFHFVRLRGSAKGHDAYRRVAIELWRLLIARQPWLAGVLFPLGRDFK